jgi:hypothetical protein
VEEPERRGRAIGCREGICLLLFFAFLSAAMGPWKARADEAGKTGWCELSVSR